MQADDFLAKSKQEYEEGYYSFRAVALDQTGGLKVHYSRSYFIYDNSSMKLAKSDFISRLANIGFIDIKITHINRDKEVNVYEDILY